ncbi:class I tRNA ligase family protein [Vibrio penaeicida]|uniref:class I tRNA ligase family protein n=1 Tax=Vibrio penaeicida TaxID=104609 RepID=UPI002735F9E7|nr:class I tRNA ligase family protein [Vibrio penaeicida]MDP2575902.1 class I tRNA ligase family protein [Vibrio penaeicida]
MKKVKLTEEFRAYGLSCTKLFPVDSFPAKTPFGSMVCRLSAGESSTPHNHHEFEVFRILEGKGTVTSGSHTVEVEAGEIVYLDAFDSHYVTNTSRLSELVFEATWWEDLTKLPKTQRRLPTKHLVTATPPTPNGDLHVGHLSGPFLAADIYKRFLTMNDAEGHYLTGVDTNQTYVELKAVKSDISPQQVDKSFGEQIHQTLAKAGVTPDAYYHPANIDNYNQQVQTFFQTLLDRDQLVLKESDALFCADYGNYLHEAWVSGECSYCGSGSDGNACEQCGRPNNVTDLKNPKTKLTGRDPKQGTVKQFVFPLSRFESRLKEYYSRVEMTPHISMLVHQMLEDGLPDIPITHQSSWGVPVPVKGFEDQIIYVWAEMVVGYLIGSAQVFDGSDQARPYHQWVDDGTSLAQFFGFDNSWYHAVLFPALLMALNDTPKLADKFVTNEFLLLDGSKFSTSRNHLIWAKDLLESHDKEAVRLYLALVRPETSQTNFESKGFERWYEQTLLGSWQSTINDILSEVSLQFDGNIPNPGGWSSDHQLFFNQMSHELDAAYNHFNSASFSTSSVMQGADNMFRSLARLMTLDTHLKESDVFYDTLRTSVAIKVAGLKTIATVLSPIAPEFAQKLWRAIGLSGSPVWADNPSFADEGAKIQPVNREWFPSLEGARGGE